MNAASPSGDFTGVILAAGRGSRMIALGETYPKPMIPIRNKPLIQHQIELMRSIGITDIVILIGHRGYRIAQFLGDGRDYGVRLRFVEQTQTLGIAHAVGQLEPHIERPFLLFLGDIFFVPGDLRQMLEAFREQGGGGILATKDEPDPAAVRRNYSVTLAPDGRVTRVIEKPRYVNNRLKGVGLYLFDLAIFDAVRRTPRTAMRDEYEITDAIQIMIDDGHPVRAVNAIQDDLNMTFPRDILDLNLRQSGVADGQTLIGPGCDIHPQARLENCVIGANVTIARPIHLRDSVVFEGSKLTAEGLIDNAIVTPLLVLNCGAPPAGQPDLA